MKKVKNLQQTINRIIEEFENRFTKFYDKDVYLRTDTGEEYRALLEDNAEIVEEFIKGALREVATEIVKVGRIKERNLDECEDSHSFDCDANFNEAIQIQREKFERFLGKNRK